MTDLSGKVCLIAGASSGMGRRTALHAGACGASVICAARRLEQCETVAADIEAGGGSAVALAFDGTDAASVQKLLEEVSARYGRLDGLFNNLGDTLGHLSSRKRRWNAGIKPWR